MKTIVITGNIGSGKSTLSEYLTNKYGIKLWKEPVNNNPYLPLFYNNPYKYGLTMQFYLHHFRYIQYQLAKEENVNCLFDRFIFDQFIFSNVMVNRNLLTNSQFEQFKEHALILGLNQQVDKIFYLKVTNEEIMRRINERNRGCENKIDPEYVAELNEQYDLYMDMLKHRGDNISIIDYNEFNREEIYKYFDDLYSNSHPI